MVSSNDIRKAYVDLYACLRKYLWDYSFVKMLVDLEDTVTPRFPDVSAVSSALSNLRYAAMSCTCKDEELADSFSRMQDVVSECSEGMYSRLVVNVKGV